MPLCPTLLSPSLQVHPLLLHTPKFQSSHSTASTSFSSFLCRLKPCSSLKETKMQQNFSKTPSSAPQRFRRLLHLGPKREDNINESDAGKSLDGDTALKGYGSAGYALFVVVYAGLEILAILAIPLTLTAGLLFGSFIGTIIVSISGTMAVSVAFLIAKYFARDRILKLVEGIKKFLAIDKAIRENGFKVVTLLCLRPWISFFLGNYLYGLTSVEFVPYIFGSWLGMLHGTWAYVSAGALGRAIIQDGSKISLGGGKGVLTLVLAQLHQINYRRRRLMITTMLGVISCLIILSALFK